MAVSSERAQSRLLTLATIIAVVAVLYFAREVLIPLAMAILVSFLLAPIVSRLQRWGFSRVPAVLTAVACASALVFVVAWIFIYQMLDLGEQLPTYKENIVKKIDTLQSSFGPWFRRATETLDDLNSKLDQPQASGDKTQSNESAESSSTDSTNANTSGASTRENPVVPENASAENKKKPVPVSVVSGPTSIPDMLTSYIGPLLAPFGTAAVIAVLAIFILIEREDLRNRFIRLVGDRQLHTTTDALDDASTRVSRYLLMLLIVNVSYGFTVSLGLWLLGQVTTPIPNVVVWGLMATVLRFIPYIGPWIAAILPIVLSLAISDGWMQPLLVIGLFIVLELLSNNVMEPLLYGSSTGISSFGIIISAVFWTWLWGGVGLVLATPLTVCLMVLGRHVSQFRYIEILLGDQPPLPLSASIYQRLLALDEDEAANTAKKFLTDHSLGELFDDVFIPALQFANQDRQQGRLDDGRWNYVHDALRELIVDLQEDAAAANKPSAEETATANTAEEPAASPTNNANTKDLGKIICLAARDSSDELAAQMLSVLFLAEGYKIEVQTARDSTARENIGREAVKESTTIESVAEQPRMIWISALPPLADARTREVSRLWTQRYPRALINAGLWNETLHARNLALLKRAGARDVATKLREAVVLTNQILQPDKTEQPAVNAVNLTTMSNTPEEKVPSLAG
jgi:predicted PurR-regulated permease PerM